MSDTHTRGNSVNAQAQRYLRRCDKWTTTGELAEHIGVSSSEIFCSLKPALAAGLVEFRFVSNRREWRACAKPPQAPTRRFSIDWPPGFVSRWDDVKVPQ
jgi:hypothetical protein